MMLALTLVRAFSLLGSAVALLVSVIVGGWDRLFAPEWLLVTFALLGLYVASTYAFLWFAERARRRS